ncbi:Uncharacterised protein at_DN0157 [Pycnogonum litorale]
MRDDDILFLQWKDNKVVSFGSTIHAGGDQETTLRTVKENGVYSRKRISIPRVTKDYNQFMGGVDLSDQLIGSYNLLLKTHKWWKIIFLHVIDIAVVNAFILFQEYRSQFENTHSSRTKRYAQLNFREELVILAKVIHHLPVHTQKS